MEETATKDWVRLMISDAVTRPLAEMNSRLANIEAQALENEKRRAENNASAVESRKARRGWTTQLVPVAVVILWECVKKVLGW